MCRCVGVVRWRGRSGDASVSRCKCREVRGCRRRCVDATAPQVRGAKVLLQSRQSLSSSSPDTPRTKVVLASHQFSSSSSPDTPRTEVLLRSRQFSASSSPATPRTTVILASRHLSSSSSPHTRAHGPRRPVLCIYHFAHSTRTISAEGCPHARQIALSPAFRALHTHDLRRGLCWTGSKRTLACISRPRHARSPQRAARAKSKTHSRLHFAHSTRTISAEGCAGPDQNALSPAFRALDTHDLRRGLRRTGPKRTLACISRPRHARSPQRVAPHKTKSPSRLHFAHSTRAISAEGCVSWRSGGTAPRP